MTAAETGGPTVIPGLRYGDAPAAMRFLRDAFGLEETLVVPGPDGTISHAEMRWMTGMVMLGSASDGSDGRLAIETGKAMLYVVVDDPDAHHARAVAAGAEIVHSLRDEDYGSRGYMARDPEGNIWSFGTYRPAPAG
jgi:uncharacterized glyoxalase superfamily protein PhnB